MGPANLADRKESRATATQGLRYEKNLTGVASASFSLSLAVIRQLTSSFAESLPTTAGARSIGRGLGLGARTSRTPQTEPLLSCPPLPSQFHAPGLEEARFCCTLRLPPPSYVAPSPPPGETNDKAGALERGEKTTPAKHTHTHTCANKKDKTLALLHDESEEARLRQHDLPPVDANPCSAAKTTLPRRRKKQQHHQTQTQKTQQPTNKKHWMKPRRMHSPIPLSLEYSPPHRERACGARVCRSPTTNAFADTPTLLAVAQRRRRPLGSPVAVALLL